MGEGNLATAAASALAAAAVKAKVKLSVTQPGSAGHILHLLFHIVMKLSFALFAASCCSGGEEDQISGGSAGGDPNEEIGD